MRLPTSSQRGGSVLGFLGLELALEVTRQDMRRISHWLVYLHWVQWRGLGDTQDRLEN